MNPLLFIEAQKALKIANPEFRVKLGGVDYFSIENALNELAEEGFHCLLHIENKNAYVLGIRDRNDKANETGDIKYTLLYKRVSSLGEEEYELEAHSHEGASKMLSLNKDTLVCAIVSHTRPVTQSELDSLCVLGATLNNAQEQPR